MAQVAEAVLTRLQYACIGGVLTLSLFSFFVGDCACAQETPIECGTVTIDDGAPGHVVADGVLQPAGNMSQWTHEEESGWFSVGTHFAIHVHPKGLPAQFFNLKRGRRILLVVRDRELPRYLLER